MAGTKMKLNNTAYSNWNSSKYNDGNTSGFAALPAGFRLDFGAFYYRGNSAYFWEAEQYDADYARRRYLSYGYSDLDPSNYYKTVGFSVRCLRD